MISVIVGPSQECWDERRKMKPEKVGGEGVDRELDESKN
jgi:hypothetical protein